MKKLLGLLALSLITTQAQAHLIDRNVVREACDVSQEYCITIKADESIHGTINALAYVDVSFGGTRINLYKAFSPIDGGDEVDAAFELSEMHSYGDSAWFGIEKISKGGLLAKMDGKCEMVIPNLHTVAGGDHTLVISYGAKGYYCKFDGAHT